jgi:hypothetical protein
MVETGVEANGMVEITRKWIVQKKLLRGLAINSEYIFRKGSDPRMKINSNSYNTLIINRLICINRPT